MAAQNGVHATESGALGQHKDNEDRIKEIGKSREMAQQVNALVALTEVLSSVPSNQWLLATYNCDNL